VNTFRGNTRVALVLGGAACVWDDLEAALDLGEFDGVVLVNDIGIHWRGTADAWVTHHPEHMPRWKQQRHDAEFPSVPVWTFEGYSERKDVTLVAEHVAPLRFKGQMSTGSSGLFGVQVAIDGLGFDKALCCGIPMNASPHFLTNRPWTASASYIKGWREAMPHLKGRVRSMSGWTAAELGKPDADWLRA
jgi:hypothetical protein